VVSMAVQSVVPKGIDCMFMMNLEMIFEFGP
jgi:hypothetical protein